MALDTGGGSSEGAGLQGGGEDVPADRSVSGVWRIPVGQGRSWLCPAGADWILRGRIDLGRRRAGAVGSTSSDRLVF